MGKKKISQMGCYGVYSIVYSYHVIEKSLSKIGGTLNENCETE